MSIDFPRLIFSILLCQAAGIVGAAFNKRSLNNWYKKIKKPYFNPPNWVFAPVWITLFILMGVSLYMVISLPVESGYALSIFTLQLILNISWSGFFFGLKSIKLAMVNIILLWLAILLTITEFYKISHLSAFLLIPYLAWVSFASLLNFLIWRLNR